MLIVCHFASDFLIFFKDKTLWLPVSPCPISLPTLAHRYSAILNLAVSFPRVIWVLTFLLVWTSRAESSQSSSVAHSHHCFFPHKGPVLFYFFIPLILIHYSSTLTHKNNHINVSDISYLYTYKIYIAFLWTCTFSLCKPHCAVDFTLFLALFRQHYVFKFHLVLVYI